MVISPMADTANGNVAPSMREMIQDIDNDRDFHMFVNSHASQLPTRPADVSYQKHTALGGTGVSTTPASTRARGMSQSASQPTTPAAAASQNPPPPVSSMPSMPPQSVSQTPPSQSSISHQPQKSSVSQTPPILPPVSTSTASSTNARQPSASSASAGPGSGFPGSAGGSPSIPQGGGFQQGRQQTPDRSFRGPPSGQQAPPYAAGHTTSKSSISSPISQPTPVSQPFRPAGAPPTGPPGNAWNEARQQQPQVQHPPRGSSAQPNGPPAGSTSTPSSTTTAVPPQQLQPYNRVFGMKLDELFRRDDSAVPLVVYQCIQAVDLFGLDTEGIYRTNGNANHISQLRSRFDHDSSKIDFRDPEAFFHDVNSVAGLLKMFFRELPDPLFTEEHYSALIQASSKSNSPASLFRPFQPIGY